MQYFEDNELSDFEVKYSNLKAPFIKLAPQLPFLSTYILVAVLDGVTMCEL